MIFADRSLLKLLWPLIDNLETVKHVVVMDDGGRRRDPRRRPHPRLRDAAQGRRAGRVRVDRGREPGRRDVLHERHHRPPEGRRLLATAARSCTRWARWSPTPPAVSERDTIMPVVPMFHANAWGLCQAAVMAGSNLAMPGPKMQPQAIAELMEGEKVTLAAGVPTIWMGVLPELKGRDLSHLREVLCGGSAVPQALSERYREQIGLPILQAWGMTETSPVATTGRIKSTLGAQDDPELAELRAMQGIAIPLVDLRIVDPGHRRGAALGRRGARRAAGHRPVDRPLLLQRRPLRRLLHRGRLAAHRRRRDDHQGRLRQARRPHQGPREVRRRVDLLASSSRTRSWPTRRSPRRR